jgi:D-alanyl-D-alanine carboxypeptidase
MDPISAVEARIGSIEARFSALAPTPADARAGEDFAAVLAAASGRAATASGVAGSSTLGAAAGTLPGGLGVGAGWALPSTATTLTPATRLAPGQYPRLTPPAELTGYGNGRVPASALQPIDASGSHRLWAPAATAFSALAADAAAAGVSIGVTDSYRPIEVQERLAREKGLYSNGGLAATPGTSNHGWGLSLDLDLDAEAQAWMRENGWRYGFVEDVPREPWHWTYRPAGNGS